MKRNCLIVDNEDQSDTIQKAERIAKRKGLNIEFHQFNVGNTENTEFLTKGKIDIEKVRNEYRKKFNGITFHLAVFDWNLDDDDIDGVELIRKLSASRILKRTPKFVISAKLKIILNEIVEARESKRIEKLSLLVKSDIRDYMDRDDYEHQIISFFENNEDSLDLNILTILRQFPEHKFEQNFVSESFEGKTFEEIAKILESNDGLRNKFKGEIIQQVLAYLSENI